MEIQSGSSTEIARQSARELLSRVQGPFIVEDAGLYIPSFSGFPGPYSHYALGTIGCEGVLKLLGETDSRAAYFESSVAYADMNRHVETFLGRVNGSISREIRGKEGFGFDPIFIPVGSEKTFGELNIEEKSEISHRRRALEAFAVRFGAANLMATQS